VIDGCPSGVELDLDAVQMDLNRRKPGQSKIVTQRKESDEFQVLSGFFEGKTIGTPLTFFIPNTDQKSKDYGHIADKFRPSHADYTYHAKYGTRDYRGGGRSSARETAARVIAGAVAKQILAKEGIEFKACVSQVGDIRLAGNYFNWDWSAVENNPVRCADEDMAQVMEDLIAKIKKEGDTIGGVVTGVITGVPAGLGEPVFDRLDAELAKAMLSINASKGFEYGSGFKGVHMLGSEHNDAFEMQEGKVRTRTNNSGGIQGGISNGEDIFFNVAFKPVATIMRDQDSVDENGQHVTVSGKGRHDPCVVPRAVPIVEAMSAITVLDMWLKWKAYR
jgi:chorismate synthase